MMERIEGGNSLADDGLIHSPQVVAHLDAGAERFLKELECVLAKLNQVGD